MKLFVRLLPLLLTLGLASCGGAVANEEEGGLCWWQLVDQGCDGTRAFDCFQCWGSQSCCRSNNMDYTKCEYVPAADPECQLAN